MSKVQLSDKKYLKSIETIVGVELDGESLKSGFRFVARVRELPDAWQIEISPGKTSQRGNRRLRLATSRLCELDAAVGIVLRAGGTVQRTIFRNQNKAAGGRRPVTELVLPLLLPSEIVDELYPYQRQGVAWLLRQKKALLGDDMGLGKTVQTLSAARRLIRSGDVAWMLIVSPRTLIANWVDEINFWAPELTAATVLPHGSERDVVWSQMVRRAHVLITSYEQIREPIPVLGEHKPELVVVDEAHRLRNFDSLVTRGFRSIQSDRVWALTGTPIERDSEDLAVLLSILDPGRFSRDDKALPAYSLTAQLRPYLLRRRKQDVLKELPEVVETSETLDLTDKQIRAYKDSIRKFQKTNLASGYLTLFNELRTICDVDLKSGASSKLTRTMDLISDIAKNDEKVVVFSYLIEPLTWLQRRLRQVSPEIGNVKLIGSMTLQERTVAIREFKTNPKIFVLLASTRTASEGLTLTEANHVIFINQWWNPSANHQARDRVVRIGQKKAVTVKSFTCRGTVEERLQDILKEKSLTFDEIVESLSESWSEVLSFDA